VIYSTRQILRGAAAAPRRHRLALYQPTGPQLAFLQHPGRNKVWRGGNQIGKTMAHAYHIVALARGTHRWRPDWFKPPVELLLLGYSWQQMDKLLREVWAFIPPGEADPRLRYEKGGGIKGFKEPRIPLVAGPGTGSVIHLRTYKQGSESFAGMEVHYVGLDEPPPPGIVGEALGRTSTHDGDLCVTMTPTPTSPPQTELKARVDSGEFADLQTTLSLAACTPLGGIPWRSEEAINRKILSWLPMERAMRRDGAWEPVREGRQLDGFREHHQIDQLPEADLDICVSLDHGIRPGRQGATFLAADRGANSIVQFDEYRPEGTTSSRDDAIAITRTLRAHGLEVTDVKHWVGDRAADSIKKAVRKDNKRLVEELCIQYGARRGDAGSISRMRRRLGLFIPVPQKGEGSVYSGIAEVNGLYHENRLFLHKRCVETIKSTQTWEGHAKDPAKDLLDAQRYGISRLLRSGDITPPRSFVAA